MTSDNLERYNVEITITPEDAKFTKRCEAAGLPLAVISMYKSALKKLVADEREACAKIAEDWRCNGVPRTGVANEIRKRGEK